jgi:hypothetical protein
MRGVSVPSEAWCILQGESPCRVRISHPPVASVAPVAEPREKERTKQVKRTQRIVQAVGETVFPESWYSSERAVSVVEVVNAGRRQDGHIRIGRGCNGLAEFTGNCGMYEEMQTRTWEAP